MAFAWDVLPIGNFIVSLVLLLGIYGFLFYAGVKIMKRRAPIIALAVNAGTSLIFFLLF